MKEKIIRLGVWIILLSVIGYFLVNSFLFNNTDKLYQNAMRSDKPVILYFYTQKCQYCQKETPIVKAVQQEYKGKIEFVFIDLGKQSNFGYVAIHKVSGVPFFVCMLGRQYGKAIIFAGAYAPSYSELLEMCNWILNPVFEESE